MRRVSPALIALALASTALGQSTPLSVRRGADATKPVGSYAHVHVLVVSVGHYANGAYESFDDADDLKRIKNLVGRLASPLGTVKFLSDGEATRTEIEQALRFAVASDKAKSAIGSTDGVVLIFQGHGERGFFLPYDVDPANVEGSAISLDWIRQTVSKLPCRHSALILDQCYAGSMGDHLSFVSKKRSIALSGPHTYMPQELAGNFGNRGAEAFLATPGGDLAFYDQSSRRSRFLGALLDELEERFKLGHPFLFRDVFSGVSDRVEEINRVSDQRQTPYPLNLIGQAGSFVFVPVSEVTRQGAGTNAGDAPRNKDDQKPNRGNSGTNKPTGKSQTPPPPYTNSKSRNRGSKIGG